MIQRYPIQQVEKVVKNVHDTAGKYTEPVLKRYPLLFTFLLVFSTAAILSGFEFFVGNIPFFRNHPIYLIIVGILALFFTGKLYQSLDKIK